VHVGHATCRVRSGAFASCWFHRWGGPSVLYEDWRLPPPDCFVEELEGALFASAPQALQRVSPPLPRLTLPHDLQVSTVVWPPPPPPLLEDWVGFFRSSSACSRSKNVALGSNLAPFTTDKTSLRTCFLHNKEAKVETETHQYCQRLVGKDLLL
jgi:hypothetical protein